MAPLPDYLTTTSQVGKRQLPRAVRKEHQKARVIGAAIQVFAKRGYQGTTIDHLVDAASIGIGNFYNLFESKEECFLLAYEEIVAGATEEISAAASETEDWPGRLYAGFVVLLRRIEDDKYAARVALVEAQTAGPAALARYERTLRRVTDLFREARKQTALGDELPPHFEEAVVGGLSWYLQQRVLLGKAQGKEAHLSEMVKIAIEPYVGQEAALALLDSAKSPS